MNLRRVCLLGLLVVACGDDSGGGETSSGSSGGDTTGTPGTSTTDAPGTTTSGDASSSSTAADESSSSSTTGAPSNCWDDLEVGTFEVLYDGFADGSEGVSFTTDGRLIVSTTVDGDGTLWNLSASGEATVFAEVPYALGLAPRADGGLWVASIGELMQPDGAVYRVSAEGEPTLVATGIDSPNFATVAPDGSVLISDDFDTRVFRVDEQGQVSTVIADVSSPNGMAYSPSGDAFYVASTFSSDGELTRYDVDGDGLPIEDTAVEILHTGTGSFNDGIAVGADGSVFVLANLAGEIWRVDGSATSLQDGEIVAEGLSSPASMAFGRGEDFDPCSAYITELMGTRVVRVSLGVEGAALYE